MFLVKAEIRTKHRLRKKKLKVTKYKLPYKLLKLTISFQKRFKTFLFTSWTKDNILLIKTASELLISLKCANIANNTNICLYLNFNYAYSKL